MKQAASAPSAIARYVRQWRRLLLDSALAGGGTALITILVAATDLYPRIPSISLLGYVLVILALASSRGLYAAILASVLAPALFDYFITPPLYRLFPSNPEDWFTCVVLLVVGIVTSQMASELRRRAEAIEREQALRVERAQELAALQERQHLSRELHDSVSQALYGISLGAHTAKEALESEPEQALESIEYVIDLAEAGLAEMRALIFELRPGSLTTEGLVAALTRQIAVLRTRHQLIVEPELGAEPDLPAEHKEALYRVAQEALHNIVKHANASTVLLRLTTQNGLHLLEIHDDGKGFDPTVAFPGHLGLSTMQERMAKIGGTITIESTVGKGTSICARIGTSQNEMATF